MRLSRRNAAMSSGPRCNTSSNKVEVRFSSNKRLHSPFLDNCGRNGCMYCACSRPNGYSGCNLYRSRAWVNPSDHTSSLPWNDL